MDFNPRPPRGGRLRTADGVSPPVGFQSTPPARGATAKCKRYADRWDISIHAPREGGDDFKGGLLKKVCNFNPRPPRGGRQGWETRWKDEQKFQSTPPARGATGHAALGKILGYISIHAPREGGDAACSTAAPSSAGFQSTPPARGATSRWIHRFQDQP